MNRTITALFDSRDDAERAQARLQSCGVQQVNITAQGQGYADAQRPAAGAGGGLGGAAGATAAEPVQDVTEGDYGDDRRGGAGGAFWHSIKSLFTDEDRPAYEEGLRRGHFLLTAQVDDDRADEAVRILEDSDAVDVDRRVEEWRSAGWTGGASRSSDDQLKGIVGDDTLRGTAGDDQIRQGGSDRLQTGEQAIPIVEEQVRVGKREVGRGGVRVRSYVAETPVNEQVTLREEHVNLERRPVDQSLSAAEDGDLFRDRTIELTETVEEAVVAKEARVVEELVVKKDVEQRTETISDTVRHTEVDVEQTGTTNSPSRSFATTETGADLIPGESDEDRRRRLAAGTGSSPTTSI